jgi:predicted Zn-dependent protease
MIGESNSLQKLKELLGKVEADQAEAVLSSNARGLTRFANSTIHQNVYEKDSEVTLRVARDGKLGVASSNLLDTESLKNLAGRAVEIADSQAENPDFESFARAARADAVKAFFDETADCSPSRRAENVKAVIDAADRKGFLAAGSHYTSARDIAYLNSHGTEQYHALTSAYVNTVVMSPTSSGYADLSTLNVDELDAARVGEEATRICSEGQNPREIDEGSYDVVISPSALQSLMGWLAYIGFTPESYQESRSFMSGRIGESIMGENISIWDDGNDPRGAPMPFDFEGMQRQRVDLVDRGVAKGVVYSLLTAKREGKKSTGHALMPGEEIGAIPMNMFFSTGRHDFSEMIGSLERGLVVTRFHYVNGFLEPRNALFTGMTRDGTFYVEGGKVKYPVKNLRFTHSMLDAFSNVEMIGAESKLMLSDWFGASVLPALKIKGLNFSGKTEF